MKKLSKSRSNARTIELFKYNCLQKAMHYSYAACATQI